MPKILLVFLLLSASVYAEPIILDAAEPHLSLADKVLFIEDREHLLNLEKVMQFPEKQWQSHDFHTFNQGYNDSWWWLRLTFVNPIDSNQLRLLEISYPVLDYITVIVNKRHEQKRYDLGDKHPFNQRPIDHRNFIVPLQWEPGETITVFLRVKSSSSIQVPLHLWQQEHFYDMDRTHTLIHGIYFGIMLVMAFYNLFVYLAVGEKNYLYYVLFVICLPTFIASLNGFAFQYLWPNATTWNDQSILVFLTLAVLFGCVFTHNFLDLHSVRNYTGRLIYFLLPASLALLALDFVLPYKVAILVVILFACIACIFGVSAGIYRWYTGFQSAKYYTIAWSSLLIGGLILALSKNNLLPKNLMTDYATQFGSALEVMLLSFALAQRINQERKMRYEAQAEALKTERALRFAQEQALDIQRRANESLELRVQERTRDLEILNRKLEHLSDTDQLTGLHNRRFLDRKLAELLQKRKHEPFEIAILLMDIDHFKQFNDTYGHQIGDRCLISVAKCLADNMTSLGSHVARYGGEEFCAVLPGSDKTHALACAEKIRQQVEEIQFTVDSHVIPVSISVGVALSDANQNLALETLVANADKALYLSKAEGRNRVTLYDEETTQQLVAVKPSKRQQGNS